MKYSVCISLVDAHNMPSYVLNMICFSNI